MHTTHHPFDRQDAPTEILRPLSIKFSLSGPESKETCDHHTNMKLFLMVYLLAGICVSLLAADASAVPLKLTAANGQSVDVVVSGVMDSSALRLYCISGALGGAFVSICLFPVAEWQVGARKALASALSGVVFSPLLLHWWNMTLTVDYVLGISAAVALCSWSVLQVLAPLVPGVVARWFGAKTAA